MVATVVRWASSQGRLRTLAATTCGVARSPSTIALSASARPCGVGAAHRTCGFSRPPRAYGSSLVTGITPQASSSSGTRETLVNDRVSPAVQRL